ncbi:ABC transporter ATP-binding protein (plasmid) [Diaphorobacter sp. HDW4B]|uniref:ABC transporter ATP-binding protein n=1 Tax=Diaphorobacter sp. HDW4B TaxID=2714925 RepID=UPI00140BCE07|nr:ABC transporter ATP-binding protein [Diaphorobacter sp. HDW4B]QIL73788.1 ABC transporter ATP-binding protein [Diaphorobacter sp. HDW4B]
MLSTLVRLLGDDTRLLRRYVRMALAYGVLCGLTVAALVPLLTGLLHGDVDAALPWLGALMAGVLVSWIARRHVEQAGVGVGVAVLQSGRHRLGAHAARLPVGWFTPQNTARIGHVVTQGMMSVAQLPAHVFTPLICSVVMPLVMVVVLWTLKPMLGIVALVALPLLAGVFALTSHMARRADAAFQKDFAQSSQRMVEFAQAQSVLRAFNGEGASTRFLEQAVEQQRQSGLRLIVLSALSAVLNVWAVQAVFATLLMAAVWWLMNGALGAGEAVAVVVSMLLIVRFIEPLLEVAGYAEVLRSARGQLDAVQAIVDAPTLPQPDTPQTPRDASVDLQAVHFRYAPEEEDVLQGVNLHVPAGSMTALIGSSGSGKSTVMRLIARFFDAGHGSVRMGGVDVRHMTDEQLAAQISQIFQDSYLLGGSIADNIRMGKPGATDQEVLQAAQQAGVAEIIRLLPEGLDTQVGEGGARLSGGERQRIAIARALIKNAPILLVDEATAALDAENQAAIALALERLRGRRTLIVIAHQLSTVAMADQIVVLEEGHVVEHGSPAQLLQQGGRYAQFLNQRKASKGWRIASVLKDGEPG